MVEYYLHNGTLRLQAETQDEAIRLHVLAQQAKGYGYPVEANNDGPALSVQFPIKNPTPKTSRKRVLVDCPEHGEASPAYSMLDEQGETFFLRCARCIAGILEDAPNVTLNQRGPGGVEP